MKYNCTKMSMTVWYDLNQRYNFSLSLSHTNNGWTGFIMPPMVLLPYIWKFDRLNLINLWLMMLASNLIPLILILINIFTDANY